MGSYLLVKETIFFVKIIFTYRKHHRKLVEADSLCWMCVKYVLCLGKEKMGEKKALNIYINNFVRHSPHKSLIYMGIWLYFWVFKFKRCFVWNFVFFSLPKLTFQWFQYITSIFFRYDDPEIVNCYHIWDEIKLNVGKVKCILHEVDTVSM